ncbi:MAG: PQQ-dependent sugar dehydrogenase [Nitrososphaerota archaeon]
MKRRAVLSAIAAAVGVAGLSTLYFMLSSPRRDVATVGQSAGYTVEVVHDGLTIPWEICFISGEEALVTERPGQVRLLNISSRRSTVVGEIEVAHVGEGGLLGLAYLEESSKIITYYTYRSGSKLFNRVHMWDSLEVKDGEVLLDEIPGASIHDGGRVKIGPDGKLYVTTGDASIPPLSQDLNSLAGKILRVNTDGTIPHDNPFPSSPIYSYGHRNPQGICWRSDGSTYATEHGPSGEGGLVANDELNRIVAGGNYGWPLVVGKRGMSGMIDPVYHSGSETWAPSGCTFYYGEDFPDWDGSLFFGALRGEHLHRVALSRDGSNVESAEKLFVGTFGRLRNVVQGPDGLLYLLTSNRDGRGSVRPGDDKVLRITPRK